MIPKLHARGQSFHGACSYVLHDVDQATTSDRVAWVKTVNLTTKAPEWAWHEMTDTYYAQSQLKAASGMDQRGRKNTKPVLHFTLSWAHGENPSPEHMMDAALASLKAIGLAEHEALIAAHSDTEHPHVHIVANTIHPQTGLTAPLKFTKLALSKWAEAYEREHGIQCDERIKNNAEREKLADQSRKAALDPNGLLMAASRAAEQAVSLYVPVKHKPKSRKQWFDRKEIINRMKAMRKEADAEIKAAKAATWQRQAAERDALDHLTEIAVDQAMQKVKEHYRPYWRDMYRAHRRETIHLRKVLAYEARQNADRPPSAKRGFDAAIKPTDLKAEQEQARRLLGRQQREDAKLYTDAIMGVHKDQFAELQQRQKVERDEERTKLYAETRKITFAAAKGALAAEREQEEEQRKFKRAKEQDHEAAPTMEQRLNRPSEKAEVRQDFERASKPAPAAPSRSDQIKSDMAEYRERNKGKDFGREI